jgi:hypothetical protein
MHRFTEVGKINKHWKVFADLLKSKPGWVQFLDDKGVKKVPKAYLVAVEQCLRAFGRDRFAFGTFAMDSPKEWHSDKLMWRKIECYIAFVRNVKEHDSYGKYQYYYWDDYLMRKLLRATFIARHLDYSNGLQQLEGLPVPKEWKNPVNRRLRKKKPKSKSKSAGAKVTKKVKKKKVVSATEVVSADESEAPDKMWDSETEEWVEIE